MAAIEVRWARIMARIARTTLTTTDGFEPPRRVNVTRSDRQHQKLVQNEVSTRILQGILGAMLLLFAVGLVFGRGNMDRVLPFSPTSVGAIMVLLKGSKITGNYDRRHGQVSGIVGIIPAGATCLGKKELRAIFEVPGRMYSLRRRETVVSGGDVALTESENRSKGVEHVYRIDFDDSDIEVAKLRDMNSSETDENQTRGETGKTERQRGKQMERQAQEKQARCEGRTPP